MDFAAYVEARRTSLVRAAVLLGHGPSRATAAVDAVLVARGRAVGRSDHPDPEVHAALARELGPPPAHPDPAPPGVEHAEVRGALLGLDPTTRAVAVLVLHADLTTREVAAALDLKPGEVAAPLARAIEALGATEEIDARELVALAADTIAVPPLATALTPAPADRRPWLAAVAVLAVVGVATALLARGGAADEPDPDPGPGGARVPSLFAYDISSARRLLESQGLVVSEERRQACEPADHVVGSDPPSGARVPDGGEVTIFTAFPENSCLPQYFDRQEAWAFIDFATGRGPLPPVSRRVDVVVDGERPLRLTAGEAGVRASWGEPSLLDEVANATEQVSVTTDDSYVVPVMRVEETVPPPSTCGIDRPAGVGRREALRIIIGLTTTPALCPLVLDLYRTDSAIDTAVLYRQRVR